MKSDKSSDRKPVETGKDPDLAGATAAMHRAAQRARRIAAANNTPVAVFENGKVVWKKADDELPPERRPNSDAK